MLMALTGLNSRGYKNSTLLFNLARIFIAHSPARALINPPWTRHRRADVGADADPPPLGLLRRLLHRGAARASSTPAWPRADQTAASRRAIAEMVDFCLATSAEEVPSHDGSTVRVVTALAPLPHPRFSKFFAQIKQDLGFGIYVPDCDTTACSFSAATQAGSTDPILDQPLLDFYAGYQVRSGANEPRVTVPLNDNVEYDGGVVTWIDNLAGDRPYGNDLDPTLNLDILEVSFRNLARWKIIETPSRLETVQRIIGFQRRLVESGAFANPRSHIYYLPELYCAYFGRCYAALHRAAAGGAGWRSIRKTASSFIRGRVLAYVADRADRARDERLRRRAGADGAGASRRRRGELYAGAALHRRRFGEGGRRGPFKAYEWNKMKTPTRILVGGPEVTSAFVLMGLALARGVMMRGGRAEWQRSTREWRDIDAAHAHHFACSLAMTSAIVADSFSTGS